MPEPVPARVVRGLESEWLRLVATAHALLEPGAPAGAAVDAAAAAARRVLPRAVRAGRPPGRVALYRELVEAGRGKEVPAGARRVPPGAREALALGRVAGLDERSAARALGMGVDRLRRLLEEAAPVSARVGVGPVLGLRTRPFARRRPEGGIPRPSMAAAWTGNAAGPETRRAVQEMAVEAWAALAPALIDEARRLTLAALRRRRAAGAAGLALAAGLASPLGRPLRTAAGDWASQAGIVRAQASQPLGAMGVYLDDPRLTQAAVRTTLGSARARVRFPLQLPAWLPDGVSITSETPAVVREYRRVDVLVAQEVVVQHPRFSFLQRVLFDADGRLVPIPWDGLASYRRSTTLSAIQELMVNAHPGVLEVWGDRTILTWVADGILFSLDSRLGTDVVARMARSVR